MATGRVHGAAKRVINQCFLRQRHAEARTLLAGI